LSSIVLPREDGVVIKVTDYEGPRFKAQIDYLQELLSLARAMPKSHLYNVGKIIVSTSEVHFED
jgi:hypothetical protein